MLVNKRDILFLICGLVLVLILFALNLYIGQVDISFSRIVDLLLGGDAKNPAWSFIVENRLNRSLVAIGAGGGLAIAGLILQVYFRNPLAGPGVLGISSGASLGVAIVILGGLGLTSFLGSIGLIFAGIIGALFVLLLLFGLARFIKNAVTLLVVGLMFGYFTSALINILFLWANQGDTREFVIWGLGSFEGLDTLNTRLFLFIILVISFFTLFLTKALNALVLGNQYAVSLGINMKRVKVLIIVITGVLAAIVTVYCGPISFIGIAVPQIIRQIIKSKNHLLIIPATFLFGCILALVADIGVRLSGNTLPLNTLTAMIGAPIIIWTIIKMNKGFAKF